MQAQKVPANHGLNWFTDGYRLFAKSPLLLTLLIFGYFFILMASAVLPVVGPLAALVLVPTFSVGLMVACRTLDVGQGVEWRQLFAGFHSNFPALLRLGFVYLCSMAAILMVSSLLDGGMLMKMTLFGILPATDIYQDEELAQARALTLVLSVPMVMGFWFAPVLAAWHRLPAMKSLFFSYFACARNLSALLLFTLVLTGAVLALSVLYRLLDVIVGDKLAEAMSLPVFLMLIAVLCASVYASYRDIFRDDPPADLPAQPPTS
jgi:hypothetical protein